jgi:hypothetical protein
LAWEVVLKPIRAGFLPAAAVAGRKWDRVERLSFDIGVTRGVGTVQRNGGEPPVSSANGRNWHAWRPARWSSFRWATLINVAR